MNLLQSLQELPKTEKIKVMEFLWNDLKSDYDSPTWHEIALKETENRMALGEEKAIDWKVAKKMLRQEFE